MDIIYLPAVLPGNLDLHLTNRNIYTGNVILDWSNVQAASQDALSTLLIGLDLVEHSEQLGLSTIPESLREAILHVLSQSAQTIHRNGKLALKKPVPSVAVAPVAWKAGDDSVAEVQRENRQEQALDEKHNESLHKATKPLQEPRTFLQPPSAATLRNELERLVLQDLLGPAGGPEEEVDEQHVHDRYLVGMLAPRDQQIQPEEMDALAVPEEGSVEDGSNDDTALQTASLCPSAIGMSFCVDGNATSLRVTAQWGNYKRIKSETIKTTKGSPKTVWKRQPMGSGYESIPLKVGAITAWSPAASEQPDVVVKGLVRRTDDTWTVTLFLVNEQREPEQRRDEAWLFQPELSVEAEDGSPIFQQRPTVRHRWQSDEEQAMAMLYRQHVSFAIGHNVGVHAVVVEENLTRASRLSTRIVPNYDVPRTEAPTSVEIPGLANFVLDMKELAECSKRDLPGKLSPLLAAYESWIREQEARIEQPDEQLRPYLHTAKQALTDCRHTLHRIHEGITLLASSSQAAYAFTFMNRAMWQQRIHTLSAEERRRGRTSDAESKDTQENRSWRPFQLAFILLNLPSLTDLHHPDRSAEPSAIADLLWFPTGGGKTEAYLGLTAYTLAIRRLQGTIEGRSGEDGVAVIMRYTLRLLTLQQFQRATALICACETIRQTDVLRWGKTPFRLGLWVGQRTTPNTTEQSEELSQQDRGQYQRGSSVGGVGSPRQLTNCPWCGSTIEAGRDIKVESVTKGRGRTFTYCGDLLGQCAFSRRRSTEGLPVIVVDEEIYRCLPSLLIATVDKFAQMPWNGATQMLFGQVNKWCSRHGYRCPDLDDKDQHRAVGSLPAARSLPHAPLRPPDLIIQDELHLISGPLGTLVALYESAVDSLSTWTVDGHKVRPKVVAATATIRRAAQQVQALFMRQVNVFPPQGLDSADNFFARQRKPSQEMPGRRYIGICASGRRLKAALIRVYVAHLAAAQYLYNQYGGAIDPWMTLVGYFNSMNELGGMRRLIEDDVRSRLGKMDQRGLAKRRSPLLEELTSRKSSTDIPEVLDKLERVFDPNSDTTSPWPLDVLLATNMISVGVDVQRLGLMVVAGQPKTTAEYIQATSRVGRSAPGLVCVVFNWARPRDLSHYEQFEHYHATFYQQVEALSVTPFAPRALDRGLAALLVSYVRLLGAEFNENSQAGNVNGDHPYFADAIRALTVRAIAVTGSSEVGEMVNATLQELRKQWLKTTQTNVGTRLGYRTRKDGQTIGLLHPSGQGEWKPFTCLNSLRDVEPSIHLILDERSLGDSEEYSGHVEDVGGVVNVLNVKHVSQEL